MQIAKWEHHPGREVVGIYRLVKWTPDFWSTQRKPRTRLTLGDATGSATCVIPVTAKKVEQCAHSDFVRVRGAVSKKGQSTLTIDATQIIFEPQPQIRNWHLLPREWVAEEGLDAFDRLLGILDRLKHKPMIAFAEQVFSEAATARHFLQIPASRKHHHATPGGLLIHSVECAEIAEALAPRILSAHERDLAVVAALLHDIGKIRTLCAPGTGMGPIHGVCQSALNLEVLAPFMPALQAAWSSGANALRAALAPAHYRNTSGGWPPLLLTDFVRYIDHLSTGADLRTKSFVGCPDWHSYTQTKQGQTVERVMP